MKEQLYTYTIVVHQLNNEDYTEIADTVKRRDLDSSITHNGALWFYDAEEALKERDRLDDSEEDDNKVYSVSVDRWYDPYER